MSETLNLPVVPMRNSVLFPGVSFPINAGRPGTLRAIEASLADSGRRVFAVSQRQDSDDVTPESLYTIGTIATLGAIQRGLGGVRLLLEGKARGIAMRYIRKNGYLEAAVQEARIEIPVVERQALLETLSVEDRLRRVLVHVQRQIDVLSAQEDIQSKVKEELGSRQREMYLREQMKAIQKELGEGEGSEDASAKDLRARLDALELPDEVRKEVDREWARLTRTGRESMESQVIRTYLETIAELPWNVVSEEHLDVQEAARILDQDHYGLKDVKDRVLEFLAVRQLWQAREKARTPDPKAETTVAKTGGKAGPEAREKARAKGRILLFAGPPGVGKTSIATSIARAMGRKYVRISLGGARDEADIRGHRRTYIGAMPGRIIQGMKQAGTRNPVFLLDEVDKLGVSFQGDPASALLEVLDPAQNDSFTDHYLGVPFDLSEVLFIATANFIQNIPGPLLDRMEVVTFAGYTEEEKLRISRSYLVPRQVRENGLEPAQLTLADGAILEVIASYTRESGVRQLERELGRLARKVARRIAARELEAETIRLADVRGLLGRPKVHPEKMAREDQIGIATGMYYTPAGGDIMFVEAYARSHAAWLGIEQKDFERDVHIHVPAGAIPKDGPSAGIAMASALVSALSRRPVRNNVAMTGEVTISGRVLPIGGLKEKVLGAVRAGIKRIVIPADNEADLEDLTQEVRDQIEVAPVETLAEALAETLRNTTLQEGRLFFGPDEAAQAGGEVPH